MKLFATYDPSGPDAWDVAAHPLVYFTSEGVGANPHGGKRASGLHAIASTKKVVASALYDLKEEPRENPHGVGISPDGKWLYIGEEHRSKAVLLIINARTLKLAMVLDAPRRQRLDHNFGFKDWRGRDRVVLALGAGANGGPHFVLDPNDNHMVVKAITIEDIGYKIGHPYVTVDPAGRFLYVSTVAPAWRTQLHNTGG